ncbi:unnamed protein product, partial [Polarella glacialis]
TSALVQGPWSDVSQPAEWRTQQLVSNMTLDEKLLLLHGNPSQAGECCQCNSSQICAYTGNVAAVPRLGIPPITMNDGPQGFRDFQQPGTSTAWPSGLAMAASWDVEAMGDWGAGMGKEFHDKGSNVQLGPGLCVARVPLNGRNFEYLSGEDPFLGYTLVQPTIKGIQSQKVVANAKHYILNNQESSRQEVSAEIDERTRFEMYYPPFEGAIEAGVGSFMCGYNKINGMWSCENPTTLAHDLKKVLGFKGYVVSDWGATHSTSLMAGLDVEMPNADWMNAELIKPALEAGAITEEAIEESVSRILWSMFSVGVMDEPLSTWDWANTKRNVTTDASVALARRLSATSTVLLRNEGGTLPLQMGKHIAVIGLADESALVNAGGSGSVVASFTSTPLDGIRAAAGAGAQVDFHDGSDVQSAAELAAACDYAIIFVGTLSAEGEDRTSLSIDSGSNYNQQNALVSAVAAVAGKKTIVVASVPGAVLMPWSGDVAAILTNFMPGQQGGNAVADVLFGKVNPSAKLPLTFPNSENETQLSPAQWPGLLDPTANYHAYSFYSEKLLVGYRYYDAHNLSFTTGFPFGHGLSYTSFEYSGLTISKGLAYPAMKVAFEVRNSGAVAGAEVAQLYLGFPAAAGEPPLQLKGFRKTKLLAAGEIQHVELELRARDLSIWDSEAHSWSVVQGSFRALVGSSSRDVRSASSFLVGAGEELYV